MEGRGRGDGSRARALICAGTQHFVTTQGDVLAAVCTGARNRATATTDMNEQSSRSHSVVIFALVTTCARRPGGGGGLTRA